MIMIMIIVKIMVLTIIIIMIIILRPKKKNVMFVVTRPTHFKPPDRNVFITFSVLKMDSRPLRSDYKYAMADSRTKFTGP